MTSTPHQRREHSPRGGKEQSFSSGNRGPATWHDRYRQQAEWTRPIRERLLASAGLSPTGRLLEVGSGTGAITGDLAHSAPSRTYGLDIDAAANAFAQTALPEIPLVTGDALRLPFEEGVFEACVCHFLLLWIADPLIVLREMRRVTAPGGWIACLAEPDYGGRIDHPEELRPLGDWQAKALRRQGAHTEVGRTLLGLLGDAGLVAVEGGVLGATWTSSLLAAGEPTEWETLRLDLEGSKHAWRLDELEESDRRARLRGSRVLYVPTFFAHGRVPPPR